MESITDDSFTKEKNHGRGYCHHCKPRWSARTSRSNFAEAAGDLPVEVTIAAEGEPADEAMDAASILSLMSLGAKHGDRVVLRAEGEGADEALETLKKILETDHDAE